MIDAECEAIRQAIGDDNLPASDLLDTLTDDGFDAARVSLALAHMYGHGEVDIDRHQRVSTVR